MAVMPPDQTSSKPRERETIEELFAALESPLLNYALRLAGEFSVAEDIVQEAFMKLHGQFQEVREPRHWLYRTVHNLALNQRRQSGKIISLDMKAGEGATADNDASDPQPLPDEQIARWEGIGFVRLSLETLDARSRELIRLKFGEDLSYKEISESLNISLNTVKTHMHAMYEKLHVQSRTEAAIKFLERD